MRINHPSLNSSLREKAIHYERKNKKTRINRRRKKLFAELMPEDLNEISAFGIQRRHFLDIFR